MSIIVVLLALMAACIGLRHAMGHPWRESLQSPIPIILLAGFAVRLVASMLPLYYASDLSCFRSWADMLFHDGFAQFYVSDAFTDYPPGYMYVLYVLGAVKSIFGIEWESFTGMLLIKLPAILADLAMGVFIYHIAAPRTSQKNAFWASMLYVLNPAVILISACWAQVDAVHTLIIVISLYFILEKKLRCASLLFVLAVIVKPQSLMFTPLFMFAYFTEWKEHGFQLKALRTLAGYILLCLLLLGGLLLPFALFDGGRFNALPVIQQYGDTLSSYPYVTVNAYNGYALFGLNWASIDLPFLGLTYDIWGIIALVMVVLVTFLYLYCADRDSKSKLFIAAAFINFSTFMFSVKMHERYSFPVMAVLLAAYILRGDKWLKRLYILGSAAFLLNYADSLRLAMNGYDYGLIAYTLPVFSLIAVLVYIVMIVYIVQTRKAADAPALPAAAPRPVVIEEWDTRPVRHTWKDFALMGGITLIYAIVAFVNLGDKEAPQSGVWLKQQEPVVIEFAQPEQWSHIRFFLGARNYREFTLEVSEDGITWGNRVNFEAKTVFSWTDDLPIQADRGMYGRFLRLTAEKGDLQMMELVLYNAAGEAVLPVQAGFAVALFDEQELLPDVTSYRNSTYFDEIYHARTAYEFNEGLEVYEWTHPPLGKLIIAVGVKAFGMNPFGWRVMGTLFGVLMLPLLYLFAKKMFRSTCWAGFATILFAVDFMHFAQTRIATIDTYITFFVIGMYYFMYRYCTTSFYQTKFWKTLVPLALSGICMGLGIACKWPGMYAGLGLAALFAIVMYNRYEEYVKKKTSPQSKGFAGNVYNKFPRYALYTCLWCVVFFVIVPAVIYVVSYIPYYFGTGSLYPVREVNRLFTEQPLFAKLLPDSTIGNFLGGVIQNQIDIFNYHGKLVSEHPYSSPWYTWLLDIRPILYYLSAAEDGMRAGISSFGNPLIWCGGLVAVIAMAVRFLERRSKVILFLIIAYMAQLLPWIFVSRTTYIYHYFPCVPFLILAITYIAKSFFGEGKRRYVSIGYLAAAVVLFIMFYPVLSGVTVPISYVNTFLKWLPSWQLL